MNEIDNRIVSMEFDNKRFESNIQTSIKSLKNLDDALIFKNGKRGFEEIEDAAKTTDLSPLEKAIDNIESKFSMLGIVGDQIIRNLTNRAIAMTENIAKAITIEPVGSGFQEYETQMKSIQTILANTKSKGTTLEQVNAALDDLNYYADKTIYNFTQMTENIGRFTAAGVDLDTSTKAIKGIANLAATSGSTAQQTSTAMYQLSQALAAGTVKLMDWNSVVNANMGGEIFQNSLMETARVHGIQIDEMLAKEGSFRETLKKGWLTTDILTETLEKFTESYEDLTDAEIAARVEYWKSRGYTEEQAIAILELGQTATDAATKVRTFTQLFDTLKEAMQSGWTMSWRYIIGDFDEATELLTAVNDEFSNIINAAADARNKILQVWHDSGGRELFIAALKNIYSIFKAIGGTAHQVWTAIFPPMTGETLTNITAGFFAITDKIREAMGITEDYGNMAKEVMTQTSDALDESVSEISNSVSEGLTKNEEKAKELYEKMPKWMQHWVDVSGSSDLARIANWRQSNQDKWYEYWEAVTGQDLSTDKQAMSIYSKMPDWMQKWVDETGSRDLERIANWRPKNQELWNSYWDAIAQKSETAAENVEAYQAGVDVDAISGADGFIVSDDVVDDISLLDKLLRTVSIVADVGRSALSALAAGGVKLLTTTLTPLIGVLSLVCGSFLDWVSAIALTIKDSNFFGKAVDGIVTLLSLLGIALVEGISYLKDFWSSLWNGGLGTAVSGILTGVFGGFMLLISGIEMLASKIKSYVSSSEIIQNGLNEIKNMAAKSGEFVSGAVEALKDFGQSAIEYFKGSELISEFGGDVKKAFDMILNKASEMYGKIKSLVTRIRDVLFGNPNIDAVSGADGGAPLSLSEKIEKLFSRIKPLTEKVKEFAKGLIPEKIRTQVSEFFHAILPTETIKGFLAKFEGLKPVDIYRKIKNFFKNLIGTVSESINEIKNTDPKILWQKLKDFVKSLNPIENIKQLISNFDIGNIKDSILNLPVFKKLKTLFDDFIDKIVEAFPDLKAKLASKVSTLIEKAKSALSWLGEQFKGLFAYLFDGDFFKLIKTVWRGLLIMKVLNTIKGITDIFKSPMEAIEEMTESFGDIAKGFTTMADTFKSKVKNIGTTILKISIAIGILVAALWALSKLDPKAFRSAMFGLVAILAVITFFVKALAKASENGAGADKVGNAILKMSIAVALLVRSVKKIAEMDLETLGKGLIGMLAMIRLINVGMRQKAGTQSMEASARTLIGIAIAVRVLVGAVKKLSQMNLDELAKGLGSMWIIIRMITKSLSTNMTVLNRGQKFKGAGLLTYIGLAASVWILAQAVKKLGEMDLGTIAQGLVAIRVLMTGMAKVMKNSSGVAFTSGAAMVLMGVAIEVLVHAASKLGELDLWSITKGLVGIRVLIKGMTEISKGMSGGFKAGQTFLMLIAVAGLMFIFIKAMEKMKNFDGGNVLALSVSIGIIVAAMSYSIAALSKVPVAGAAKAVGILLAVIAVVGLIAWGLGALLGEEGTNSVVKAIDNASKIMYAIGNFLGSFFRGLLGISDKTSGGGLTSIGKTLSNFMKEMEPFFDKVQNVDSGAVEGVKNLASVSTTITGAGVAEAIGSLITKFFTGKSTAENVTGNLCTFADGLVRYQKKAKNLNQADIDTVNAAITSVGDVVKNHIPEQSFFDRVAYAITGVSDLTIFAEGLEALGMAISTYSTEIQGVDSEKIAETTPLLQSLVDLSNAIPDKGVIALMLEKVTGVNNIKSFCDKMVPLAESLKTYSNAIGKETSWDNVKSSALAIQSIVDVANAVPKVGLPEKAFNFINTDFGAFIDDLSELGRPLRIFRNSTRSFTENDATVTDIVSRILMSVVNVANAVPKVGLPEKAFNFINTDFGAFIDDLSSLKDPLQKYIKAFTGKNAITTEEEKQADRATGIFKSIVEAANLIPEQGFLDKLFSKTDMESFVSGMTSLGEAINSYVVSSGNLTSDDVTKIGASVAVLRAFITQMESATSETNSDSVFTSFMHMFDGFDGFDVASYGDKLAQFGRDVGVFAHYLGNNASSSLSEAVANAENLFPKITALFANSDVSDNYDIFTSNLSDMETLMSFWLPEFYNAGGNIVSEVNRGMTEANPSISSSLTSLVDGSATEVDTSCMSQFYDIGKNVVIGLANGIRNYSYVAVSAARSMAGTVFAATRNTLSIHSPSQVFADMGRYCAMGLANGIYDQAGLAENSASDMADRMISTTEYALRGIIDALNADDQLVITPVLDLSNVQTGMSSLNHMLSTPRSVSVGNTAEIAGLTARNARAISEQTNQNGRDFSGIIGAISSVNDRIDALGEKMANMQVVLNSGALVGQIAGDMDRNLGQRTILRGRGN